MPQSTYNYGEGSDAGKNFRNGGFRSLIKTVRRYGKPARECKETKYSLEYGQELLQRPVFHDIIKVRG